MAKKESKKQKVCSTFLKLVSKRGYHNTPMSMLSSESGVAIGTIYHHFSGKEDLTAALYLDLKERMGAAISKDADKAKTPKDKFMKIWNNLFEFYAANKEGFLFLEFCDNNVLIDAKTAKKGEGFMQPVVNFINEQIKAGKFRKIGMETALAFIHGSVVSLVKLKLTGKATVSAKTAEEMADATYTGLKK
jgi:AcrR family transcriptional regulator